VPSRLRLGGCFPAPPSALLPLGVCKVEDDTRILARFQWLQILLSSMVNLSLMRISKTERRNFLQPLRVVGCTSRHLIWRDDTFTFFTLACIFLQLILGRIYLALTICRRVYVRNIIDHCSRRRVSMPPGAPPYSCSFPPSFFFLLSRLSSFTPPQPSPLSECTGGRARLS
jgi:hypothetical protein